MLPPSGEQFELRLGTQRAVVTEVGATLRRYSVAEQPILDGFGVEEMCTGARGQPLLPWPNRIADGRYVFDGEQQLALTEPATHHAIHGLVRWASFRVRQRGYDRVTLAHTLLPQPGYPFALALEVAYRLEPRGLAGELRAHNLGSCRCPFGAGAPPYLVCGAPRVDEYVLEVPARTWIPTDERQVPLARTPVEGSSFDFRSAHAIGSLHLYHAFTDLERGAGGIARV